MDLKPEVVLSDSIIYVLRRIGENNVASLRFMLFEYFKVELFGQNNSNVLVKW